MTTIVYLGSDHAGYDLKNEFKKHLENKGVKFVDLGVFNLDFSDYPDMAREVCEKVVEENGTGVLICGTGIGMEICANRRKNIRAANCLTEEMAKLARQHNHANVLCIASRLISADLAKRILDTFLSTDFDKDERHERRVAKIEEC